jgi:hypothetical protein
MFFFFVKYLLDTLLVFQASYYQKRLICLALWARTYEEFVISEGWRVIGNRYVCQNVGLFCHLSRVNHSWILQEYFIVFLILKYKLFWFNFQKYWPCTTRVSVLADGVLVLEDYSKNLPFLII